MNDDKKELADFVYTISHDLNAPLRHICEFSKILKQSLDGKLSEEEKEYFGYIIESGHKAENIIESLLQYSRLNIEAFEVTSFDCHDLVQKVIHSFKLDIEKTKAHLNISNMPIKLQGDRNKIEKLFHVIIENALRFQKPDKAPEINITANKKKGGWVFSISDNGIGMNPENHENVFQIFKQLDPDNYPSNLNQGMGIGLTLAKKIIDQHHGKIWLESALGKGTTVHFMLKDKT